jgi:hypothetical protein
METAVGGVRHRPGSGEEHTIWSALRDPAVDRAAAIAAGGPFAWMIHHRLFVDLADVIRSSATTRPPSGRR